MDFNPADFKPMTEEERTKMLITIVSKAHLKLCAFRYKKDCNPLYVWNAINICSYSKMPFPPWVLNYLQEVSSKLTSYAFGLLEQGEKKQSDIYKILGMSKGRSGPGDFFHNFSTEMKNVKIGSEIQEKLNIAKNKDIKEIIKYVAKENGVSKKTAENIWYGDRSAGIKRFKELQKDWNMNDF